MKKHTHFILIQLRDLILMGIFGIFISFLFGSDFTFKSIIYSSIYGALIGFSLWKGNHLIGTMLGKICSWEENPTKMWLLQLSGLFVFSVLDIIAVNYLWYTIIFGNDFIKVLIHAKWILISEFIITVIFASIFYSRIFFKFWRKSIINQEKIKRQVLALQYDSLKNQVNPHFLFNSFNTLSSLIEKDKTLATKFLKQLSDVYRYVLDQRDNEIVDLSTEMDFVKSYVYLQQIRHNENLKVNINLSSQNYGFKVVPLSLQMLVENAIKHNVISKEQPLIIDIYDENSDYIIVKNNLQIKNVIKDSNGLGLENIKSRFEFMSDKKVEILKSADEFIVKLPIIK
ncbi:MAG: histidine kinase [Bacteroidetes bacterium]|nr:MAG: histidine kinase [Bacteroidota bacterium]